ncbi:tryptophan dimethylallyltransferase family protein [Streptomyces scabiei]|uniref:tryptophan dimethylallyltransferase family protein n=1 Tax=Streptomyces scabiei TaxID=1930 RepID=UPI0036883E8D
MSSTSHSHRTLHSAGGATRPDTALGTHVSGRLHRLCDAAGVVDSGERYGHSLRDLLGPAAELPLSDGPVSASFVSDDHTPAELSMAFSTGAPPSVRLLAEPGCTAATLAENGRMGWTALGKLAARWAFSVEPLQRVHDLFFPAAPQGAFALWCALELRASGEPGVKTYVNPLAHGRHHSAQVLQEAMARLGYGSAWPSLLKYAAPRYPECDEFLFFAVDLGAWAAPRVKVYVVHCDFSADGVQSVSGMLRGGHPQHVGEFCRTVGGTEHFNHRPLVSCLAFTEQDTRRPSAYTLHVPVRDYADNDQVARDRAASVLRRHGMDPWFLDRALAAMTERRLADGSGLISYISLVQGHRQPPRVTAYFSPEAYRVNPPRGLSQAERG